MDFEEYLKMISVKQCNQNEDGLREAFNVFDKDGSGFITFEELKQVMESLGEKLTDAEVNEMLTEADEDSDGQVSFEGRSSFFLSSKTQISGPGSSKLD